MTCTCRTPDDLCPECMDADLEERAEAEAELRREKS